MDNLVNAREPGLGTGLQHLQPVLEGILSDDDARIVDHFETPFSVVLADGATSDVTVYLDRAPNLPNHITVVRLAFASASLEVVRDNLVHRWGPATEVPGPKWCWLGTDRGGRALLSQEDSGPSLELTALTPDTAFFDLLTAALVRPQTRLRPGMPEARAREFTLPGFHRTNEGLVGGVLPYGRSAVTLEVRCDGGVVTFVRTAADQSLLAGATSDLAAQFRKRFPNAEGPDESVSVALDDGTLMAALSPDAEIAVYFEPNS